MCLCFCVLIILFLVTISLDTNMHKDNSYLCALMRVISRVFYHSCMWSISKGFSHLLSIHSKHSINTTHSSHYTYHAFFTFHKFQRFFKFHKYPSNRLSDFSVIRRILTLLLLNDTAAYMHKTVAMATSFQLKRSLLKQQIHDSLQPFFMVFICISYKMRLICKRLSSSAGK